jgi:hypothetical protein
MVVAKQSIDQTRDRIAQMKMAARLQCIKVEAVVDADVVRSLILPSLSLTCIPANHKYD